MFAWSPDTETIRRAQLTRFLAFTGHTDWPDVYRWSIEDVEGFTNEVLRFLRIPFATSYTRVIDLSRGPEWPSWCVGARMNIADACLRHPPEQPAIIQEGEEGTVRTLTYGELSDEVRALAAGLRKLGVRQ